MQDATPAPYRTNSVYHKEGVERSRRKGGRRIHGRVEKEKNTKKKK